MSDPLPAPFDIPWQDAMVLELEADFAKRTVRLLVSDTEDDEYEFAFSDVTHLDLDQALGFEVQRVELQTGHGSHVLMLFDEEDDEMARIAYGAAARIIAPI